MFLKRIEAYGFKSFADKTTIEFKAGVAGIVGPNGCGKSNIADAIRWVLGEQSIKSLRGANMVDVIFAGSADRKPQNVAEVTLVFDNHKNHLKIGYEEVQITRRLYRSDGSSEYLLNGSLCRLKDIVDLIMDTGLGKGSLSIISQGNIASFAESKPEERRAIFEEAAGVAKYKKRKLESIRKLERTSDNLSRIEDIVAELSKQVGPLQKQAEKATTYLKLKASLETVEVSLIVNEINQYQARVAALDEAIKQHHYHEVKYEGTLMLLEQRVEAMKADASTLDIDVNQLQGELIQVMDALTQAETSRIALEAKRETLLNSEDVIAQKDHLTQAIMDITCVVADRDERLIGLNEQVTQLKASMAQLRNDYSTHEETYNGLQERLNKMHTRHDVLTSLVQQHAHYSFGVKSILDAKQALYGIEGLVSDLFEIEPMYQVAINTALGAAAQYVVTTTDVEAKEAILYLKKNKAGRATFLPLNVIKRRSIQEAQLIGATSVNGYLGVAADYVVNQSKYDDVLRSILGHVLLTTDIESATKVAQMTYNRFKVVSLEGDVIHAGGSMSGGQQRSQHSLIAQTEELEKLKASIPLASQRLLMCKQQMAQVDQDTRRYANDLIQKQVSYSKVEDELNDKKQALSKLKADYERIAHESFDEAVHVQTNELIAQLNALQAKKDEVLEQIKSKRETRMAMNRDMTHFELELKDTRKLLNEHRRLNHEQAIEATQVNAAMATALQRLNEAYQMTYEYACEHCVALDDYESAAREVKDLRAEMSRLGMVNLEAIEAYEEVKTRYDFLTFQKQDLIVAQNAILEVIKEMDEIMSVQFKTSFEQINANFNEVFRRLFGGGKATLRLSDPDDILETGVDIEVQPPGKSVQNISLFSGGEKALIAISGLFAILKAKPIPLCILDEVEAALDQVNVERFAKYLKDFSDLTQFIVVTHRSGTMEECDYLYGVTMQEKGVTRMFSVDLEQAVELVE